MALALHVHIVPIDRRGTLIRGVTPTRTCLQAARDDAPRIHRDSQTDASASASSRGRVINGT
jgi:hypothetical protein